MDQNVTEWIALEQARLKHVIFAIVFCHYCLNLKLCEATSHMTIMVWFDAFDRNTRYKFILNKYALTQRTALKLPKQDEAI